MDEHIYIIVLAGGQGSRFWPQSRTLEPKQFLSLHKDKSLFEHTLIRIKPLIRPKNILIVTSELYRHTIEEIIKDFKIPAENLIFEPNGRNTAPSIGLGLRFIQLKDPLAKVCILPCDHFIKNKQSFLGLLKKAFALCKEYIFIFGVPAYRPATGYGYIKIKKKSLSKDAIGEVERFCEKPDVLTARRFIKDRAYFWNSGIFVGSNRIFLEEYRRHTPGLYRQLVNINTHNQIDNVWDNIQPISFDYAILEKSKFLRMFSAAGIGWSDLGSWQAWDEALKKDKNGNLLKADTVNIGSKNITVVGNKRLIATIGLDDLIIVDTPDALLITKKEKSEEVRRVVDILKARKRQEYHTHRTVKRPWGSFTVLEMGNGFKVKLVEVKPRQALSLQYHLRRSEHWVVVEGNAKIVKGTKSCVLDANKSTYVPVGCKHRLINPTDKPLKIIEVQSGDYLGEEDIIRIKDSFGRLNLKSDVK